MPSLHGEKTSEQVLLWLAQTCHWECLPTFEACCEAPLPSPPSASHPPPLPQGGRVDQLQKPCMYGGGDVAQDIRLVRWLILLHNLIVLAFRTLFGYSST